MQIIFRTVFVSKRQPPELKSVVTDRGILTHYGNNEWGNGISTGQKPKVWLEEIVLPTDEEILKHYKEKKNKCTIYKNPYCAGAKWMRELINDNQ